MDERGTAAASESSVKQEKDPIQAKETEEKSANANRQLAEIADDLDETEGRASKLECLSCGILRRRRARGRKTPRLEFAEDPPHQPGPGAPSADDNSKQSSPRPSKKENDDGAAGEGSSNTTSTPKESTTEGDSPVEKQETTDAENLGKTAQDRTVAAERAAEELGAENEQKTTETGTDETREQTEQEDKDTETQD